MYCTDHYLKTLVKRKKKKKTVKVNRLVWCEIAKRTKVVSHGEETSALREEWAIIITVINAGV